MTSSKSKIQREYYSIFQINLALKNRTKLGVDRVKPWNSVRINLVLGLRGPDIRPGLDKRHLIIEDHKGLRRS